MKLFLVAALGLLVFSAPRATARILPDWSYAKLFKQADLIVVATVITTENTTDTYAQENWPLNFAGRVTTFRIEHTLKGKAAGDKVALLHFAFGEAKKGAKKEEIVEVIDGPRFLPFCVGKPAAKEGAGEKLQPRKEYCLFLKKRKEGRYEAVSGQLDPVDAVRVVEKLPSE